jgi:hypothetical protein
MFKRVRWMAMGMGLGVLAQRKAKRWMKSYTPPEVAARAARRSSEAAGRRANELRGVFAEGRQAMRQREAELRQQADLPPGADNQHPDNQQADDHRYPPPVHYRPGGGR